MKGRRMFLRLGYWGKILRMDAERLVRQVYEEGRARLEADPNARTWCSLTRMWLHELGLQAEWTAQVVRDDWRDQLKEQIMKMEEKRWRQGVMHNVRLQGYAKWKAELTLDAERYLQVQQVNRRRMWTKLRGGCLELRLETGRWEMTMVMGKQVKMPRWIRLCTLCFEEVEDAEHTLFRCPCFKKLRTEFLEGCGLAGKEREKFFPGRGRGS